ncbi:MAG: 1-acyl-sn-glycerol-3-phosphate acyltransferase [Actinomycetia bacterium]|nr:1-acyl-sn-glycerol-3-phosphate acyltransferase [Actinomycetes bacterium]
MTSHVSGVEGEQSLALEGAARLTYRAIRSLLRLVATIYFRLEVKGRENLPEIGGFVLAPGGHRSIIDTPMVSLAGYRVLRYMGAETYFNIPGFGWFLRAMGGFPVERTATDRSALRLAEWVLNNGEPLAVFPEGTRQEGPIIQPLKEGAAFLACRTGVPIVPVGIGGSERAMPRGRHLALPRKITMVIGEPILPPVKAEGERVKRSSVRRVTDQLSNDLQILFDEAQIRAGV